MKKNELRNLKFKDYLPVVYEDIEPHLIAELNKLRNELITLPRMTNQDELLFKFEQSIRNFNKIDQDTNIESHIDTEEREGICKALETISKIVGLETENDCFYDLREW